MSGTIEPDDDTIIIHTTPKIDESCDHDWAYAEDEDGVSNPSVCTKCGISFTAYVFCCCP